MWNNIPGSWNSGRCGTALLCLQAAAELTHTAEDSALLPSCKRTRQHVYFWKEPAIFLMLIFFFTVQFRRYRSYLTLFVPAHSDCCRLVPPPGKCQSIMCLLHIYMHGLLLASHGKFMYSVLRTWAPCCWKWTMFIVRHFVYCWWVESWMWFIYTIFFYSIIARFLYGQ